MHSSINRRRFFQRSAVVSSGAFLVHRASVASGIAPVPRNGSPKFNFSLAAYSYKSLLEGKNAKFTMSDFIDDCAKMQIEAAELTSYYFKQPITPEYLRSLKQQCFRLGLSVSGTAIRTDFGYADKEKRKQQIEHTKTWIRHAETLGAPGIRVFAGKQHGSTSTDETHKLMVSAIQECCEVAGEHGVHLALENHGGPTRTAQGILKFMRDIDSPWFGFNLDTGNYRSDKAYEEIEQTAAYAINVQIKVVMKDLNGNKRPADFSRLAKIIRNANYRGNIVLEYEEKGDPRTECPQFMKQLQQAFQHVNC